MRKILKVIVYKNDIHVMYLFIYSILSLFIEIQFSGMGNFAMTIWNSTCNPCFSTFEQFFFMFHGLKTGFFYSLKLNFICYLNRFIYL